MMMKFKNVSITNEKGFTLVELLAAILLFFTICGLIYTLLFQSVEIFHKESKKIDLQQEANRIATQLETFYRKNGEFTIAKNGEKVIVKSKDAQREYSIPDYSIQITSTDQSDRLYQSKLIKITISGKETFELTTNLSRLKEVSR